jgi:alpha-D-xyloside xylohydrolase
MMRAMILEFPHDPACDTLERQYLLGDSLLVAPVFSEDGGVDYYLPEGRWTHLLTGEVQTGGRWYRAQHDFLSLPLWVRPGTILPLGARDDRPDYEFADGVTFRAYEPADGARSACTVPTLRGEAGLCLEVRRRGAQIEATVAGASTGGWRLQLAGVKAVAAVEGGTASADPLGIVISPTRGSRVLRVTLAPSA